MLCILLPAAGASSRMRGDDKLLQDVDGRSCLETLIARAAQITDAVIVTVPTRDHPRAKLAAKTDAQTVIVENWQDGMSASLIAGVAAVPDTTTALMILPADMPEITAHDMAQMWAVFQVSGAKILQAASAAGDPGHPVIFGKSLFGEFRNLKGDKGAASLIAKHARDHILFPLADDRALTDLDTPEDWAKWRANRTP